MIPLLLAAGLCLLFTFVIYYVRDTAQKQKLRQIDHMLVARHCEREPANRE